MRKIKALHDYNGITPYVDIESNNMILVRSPPANVHKALPGTFKEVHANTARGQPTADHASIQRRSAVCRLRLLRYLYARIILDYIFAHRMTP